MPPRKKSSAKLDFAKVQSIFFFSLIIGLSIGILYLIRPFFYPIFWAAVLAITFYPMYTWFGKHFKSGSLCSSFTILAVLVLIFLPMTLISVLIVNESVSLYQSVSVEELQIALEKAGSWLEGTPMEPYVETARQQWPQHLANATKTASTVIFNSVKNITQNSLRFLVMFFVMMYTLFYFFRDGKRILKRIMHLSPLGDKYEAMLYERFTSTTRATLKSTIIVGSMQGILSGLLFWITGIQGAFIWGVIMVIIAIIPAIGTSVVLGPAAIIMLIVGNFWQGVVLLVGAFIISMLDNLIRPPLIGKDIQMHPLIAFFATLGGILVFGISGFVIGPIIAALYISIMSIYDHYYMKELKHN